jgi:hypothetical protein
VAAPVLERQHGHGRRGLGVESIKQGDVMEKVTISDE